jgi:hypothetical protein
MYVCLYARGYFVIRGEQCGSKGYCMQRYLVRMHTHTPLDKKAGELSSPENIMVTATVTHCPRKSDLGHASRHPELDPARRFSGTFERQKTQNHDVLFDFGTPRRATPSDLTQFGCGNHAEGIIAHVFTKVFFLF